MFLPILGQFLKNYNTRQPFYDAFAVVAGRVFSFAAKPRGAGISKKKERSSPALCYKKVWRGAKKVAGKRPVFPLVTPVNMVAF
ncbi:hypothetical protein [Alloalcanivorax venustensis]|uniref:hypothetical protein n=1 Tax=Alloalcanivorax venustensis TaxID=172371 RepID=UPI00115F69DF|nr:hypothetical protein [Alloalcanivorax venustensis]